APDAPAHRFEDISAACRVASLTPAGSDNCLCGTAGYRVSPSGSAPPGGTALPQSRIRSRPQVVNGSSSAKRQLPFEIELACRETAFVPLFSGQHEKDLELVAVGVSGVQAQAVAVVGLANQVAAAEHRLSSFGQVLDRGDLPGGVVHADLAPLA